MEQVNHEVDMIEIDSVDMAAKVEKIEDVITKCQKFFYDEINALPDGVIQYGEDLIYAAGEIYGSIVYEGLKNYKNSLLTQGVAPEEMQPKLEDLMVFSEGCFQHKVKLLMDADIASSDTHTTVH